MKPEVPPKNGTRRYAVFLSYRHADNKEPGRQWATWLHQMLENYEIPSDLVGTTNSSGEVIPASLYPVFRDEEELPADAVYLLTGYRADTDLLTRAGVTLNERDAPVHDPATFETNVPGLFVAGGAIAGVDTGTIFIENGRFHGEKIIEEIARRR